MSQSLPPTHHTATLTFSGAWGLRSQILRCRKGLVILSDLSSFHLRSWLCFWTCERASDPDGLGQKVVHWEKYGREDTPKTSLRPRGFLKDSVDRKVKLRSGITSHTLTVVLAGVETDLSAEVELQTTSPFSDPRDPANLENMRTSFLSDEELSQRTLWFRRGLGFVHTWPYLCPSALWSSYLVWPKLPCRITWAVIHTN